ncbi:hypothetical protein B0A79_09360 [Flavobacterium piscis]|jgi:hypothetical protein|uniref:Uncharacterized protein n=1 Tax=Flavobacterium piscis TaxID=1114874 RepID=A0ABX2XJW5_9FLAO|nr:hypothetical protein [Flavobacterium piscis]OCB75275.1 hypothetical protein FLP_09950 [Flavobacterium piscis]OXG05269.1 hypothetical protein B0A79_09360 [Flavobacterium piscis]
MELNDLKSDWKNAGKNFKSEADLRLMTKIVNHPSIKKIRTKLIIEAIVLSFFLFIYYDWFDGDKKPFYANVSLVVGLLLYIFNDVIGYISITRPIKDTNLKLSLQNYLLRIERLSISSVIITFLYSISIIIFFTSVITFTKEKGLILIFSVVLVVQFILLSLRMWTKWIKNLKIQVREFNIDEES